MKNVPEYLHAYVEDDLITVQHHPELPLIVCNYTNNTQYSEAWDDVTLSHRGLVLHAETGDVVSHCLPKFFNYEEHQTYDWLEDAPVGEDFVVYEKMDGSYISVRNHPDFGLIVASRGSFTSEHAGWAREIIDEHDDWDFDPSYTYIFELIHPENRIIVDYRDMRDLVLLDILNEEGKSVDIYYDDVPFTIVQDYGCNNRSADEILEDDLPANDFEGYVVRYLRPDGNDLRLKVKLREYVRVHSLVYGMSKKEVLEYARDGTINEIMAQLPKTGFEWVEKAVNNVSNYAAILDGSSTTLAEMVAAMDADPRTEYETIMSVDGVSKEIKNLAVAKLRNNHPDKIEDSIWKYVRRWTRDKTIPEIANYGNGRNREK